MRVPSNRTRLPRSFYDQPTEVVARQLLGKTLLRRVAGEWLGGFIVETEAYLADGDLASHSVRGQTKSNAAMFGAAGTLYVYPIHAKHCMNVVTDRLQMGSAVLIRAIEPVWGLDQMMENRGTNRLRRLTRGPAMLCQALQIDRSQDKVDLMRNDEILIGEGPVSAPEIVATPRIGISNDTDLLLRFFLDGNWFVSGLARDHRTRPRMHRNIAVRTKGYPP